MKRQFMFAVSALLAFLAQLQVWGAPVLLKAGAIDPANRQLMARSASFAAPATKPARGDERVYIVQRDGLVNAAWRAELTKAGARILRYLPENAYLIRATAETAEKVEREVAHAYFGEYRPEHRMDVPLRTAVSADAASRGTRTYVVSVFEEGDRSEVAAAIAAVDGCKVLRGNGKALRAELTPKGVEAVASLAAVEWVEPYREREIANNVATEKPRMNVTSVWPGGETSLGLTGAGQVVAIADTGLDTGDTATLHQDIRGRVTRAYALGRSGDWSDMTKYSDIWNLLFYGVETVYEGAHGTHVAGSVLGNGKMSSGQIKGPAYEASLIFQSTMASDGSLSGIPDDLNDLFQQAYDDEGGKPGARIHSNSWRAKGHGEYTGESQNVDEFTFAHPDMLIVFGAGNEGVDADGNGVVDLNSLGTQSSAKNCLTVGASENQRTSGGYSGRTWGRIWPDDFPAAPISGDYPSQPSDGAHQGIVAFSSRGPCADGRVKPDIVAPGTDILSTKVGGWPADWVDKIYWGDYNDYYAYMGGTSMATPLTSGAAALVRQWLARDCKIANPDGATVKALMLSGAQSLFPGQYGTGSYQEIPKGYPNNVEGWGQVNLGQTLQNPNGIVVKDAQVIGDGETQTFTVNVPMDGALRIVLAYADAPGSTSAAKALVNDLDLLVKGPDGTSYYPNSGTAPDRVNNVEGVRLEAAKAGEYVISVKAYSIATPMETSLTGGREDAVRYSLAVIGAKEKSASPPPAGNKPDLRPWTLVDKSKGWTWSAPLVLLNGTWNEDQSCDLVGKTQFSAQDDIYVNWAVANFSDTYAVRETYKTVVLVDGDVGKTKEGAYDKVYNLVWTTYGLDTLTGDWSGNWNIGKLSVGRHKITLVVDSDNDVDRLQPDQNTYEVTIEVTGDGPTDSEGLQYGLGKVSTIGDFPDSRVSSTIVGIKGLDHDNAESHFDTRGYPYVLSDSQIVDAEKLSGNEVDYTWCQQLTDVDVLTFTGHASAAYGYDDEDDFADYLRSNPSLAEKDLVAEALSKEGASGEFCRTWISSDYSKFADTLEESFADGEAMASIGVDFGDVVHVMAVCGYAIDKGYRPNDPDRLVGLYCIDPDDDKRSDVRKAQNQIRFYYVYWDADARRYFMSRDYTWEGKSYDDGAILCEESWGLGYVLRAKAGSGTVTVAFDANGGECATKSQNFTIGSKYGTLPRAEKGGTTFLGWYTKLTGGKRINAVSTVSADVTCLFARWQDEETGPGPQGGQALQEVTIALGSSAGTALSPAIRNGGTTVTFKKVMFPTWVTGAKLRLPDGDEEDVYKGLVKVDWDGDARLEVTAEANEGETARTDKLVLNDAEDNTKVFCTVHISQAAVGGKQPAQPFSKVDDGLSEAEKEEAVVGVAASTYDGYLVTTNGDASVVGLVTVKVDKKGKVKATLTRLGAKKLAYKGQAPIDADGEVDLVCTKDPAQMHLTVYAGGIEGTCGEHKVTCRKNVAKENAAAYLSIQGMVWTVALKASEFEASETTSGYASLTVTAAKKGKVKVKGMLPDGTKVSASAQAQILSDGAFVIPIVAQLYSRKSGGISLFLQVDANGGEPKLTGVGDWVSPTGSLAWDAAQSCCTNVPVAGIVRKMDQFVLENPPETIQGMNVATQFLHTVSNMTFAGKKWQTAKGGKIKLMGADFVDLKASPNPGGLTLSYAPKTGAFKGKYAVFVNRGGKAKKLSATVNGVIVGDVGYGTAVIKKKCSIPVRVEPQEEQRQ